MALQTLNIDDRNYRQLVDFLRKQIPTAQWTDHNPSDPGIAILELLCWLGEMSLYRMNRISDAHREKYLDLLIDPPEPVTVEVTFVLDPPRAPAANGMNNLTIQAGTRLATEFNVGKRVVFETLEDLVLKPPQNPLDPQATQAGTVLAREHLEIENERLGVSDGTPNQIFELRPSKPRLGLADDHPAPVLLDFVYSNADYDPNPEVAVAGNAWGLKQFLLTDEAKVDAQSTEHYFMIEPNHNRVRFGTSAYGGIPPEGDAIVCTRYRILQGPPALIGEDDLQYVLDDIAGVGAGESLAFTNTDAQGGMNFYPPRERLSQGLSGYRKRHRLITADDFEQVLLIEFNEFLELAGDPRKILRVQALMNRRPPLVDGKRAVGHVTLLILARQSGGSLQDGLRGGGSVTDKQAMIDLAPEFSRKIERFLDQRRLITTRLHLVSPQLVGVEIDLSVIIVAQYQTEQMRNTIESGLYGFINILSGGFDGKGWSLGQPVRRSKLYQLIEDIDGVDHVETLSLTPSNQQGDVSIGAQSLPVLQQPVTIRIERA